jgi:MFS family permease
MHATPHLRRNFWMHCLEGGFYMAGLAFLSPETVMPGFVKELGGPANLIAMMPVLLPAMFNTPGLFVAPLVERLQHHKPFVMVFGLLQRLPYLIAALVMMFAPEATGAILPIVVLTPVLSGLIGGIGVNAWMEMVTRMIPEGLRASGWAIRYLMQGLVGLSAGPVIHWMLTHHPGAAGYARLHFICFGFLILSFLAQMFMVESPSHQPSITPRQPYPDYLRSLPGLLRIRPMLIRLIFARFTGMGFLMLVSFLSIHALEVTHRPQADVGHLVLANMIGSLFGNVFAGWWGNRRGGKALMLFSRSICLLLCLLLPWIESFPGFLGIFFLWGFGLFVDRVGDLTLSAELCPVERRPTYQAMLSFCQMLSFISAVVLSGWLYSTTQNFHALIALCAVFATLSIFILRTIPEVRLRKGQEHHQPPVMGENTPMV